MRLPYNISIDIDIDKSLKTVSVPKITTQELVPNLSRDLKRGFERSTRESRRVMKTSLEGRSGL